MLPIESYAPDFTLPNETGEAISLSRLLQAGPLILYFYPADFTPGCTKEACSIRDMHDDILTAGLQVAGVSPQDAESHKRFKNEYELPFTLLSDPDKTVISLYDVDGPFGVGVRRATYLINQDRTIQAALTADVMIRRHNDFIRKAIELRDSAGNSKRT